MPTNAHNTVRPIPTSHWRLMLALLFLVFSQSACQTNPAIGGPVVPPNTEGAGQLTLAGGTTYWVLPAQLALSGSATFVWPDGKRYQGTWLNGAPHGNGTLNQDDITYVGEFVEGKRQGQGTQTAPSGTYTGQWLNDLLHGQASVVNSNQDRYQGQYQQGLRHGSGKLTSADGTSYQGNWQAGSPSGNGRWQGAFNSYYEGSWQAGKRHGYGEARDAIGSVYTGTWAKDKYSGFGKLVRADGSEYEGEWSQGLRQGTGVETFASGGQHEGEWLNNQAQGPGTRITRTGIVIHGTFTGDSVSNGLLSLPGGEEYAGRLFRRQMTQVAPRLLNWTQTLATAGNPHAQLLLGTYYQQFTDPAPDSASAQRWYAAASKQLVHAHYLLGQLLVNDNPKQAFEHLQKAANQQHTEAEVALGEMYHTGRAVSPNAATALSWYERAMGKGNPRARLHAAWLLATSQEEFIRDPERALSLIQATAIHQPRWDNLDTLAAAHAALGQFAKAAAVQQQAIAAADPDNVDAMQPLRQRLALYQSNKPYIELVLEGD